jgi:ATP-dependent DNA helicase RecQ
VPLVNDIVSNGISGSIGILTKTNEEVLLVAGLLNNNRIPAKIIQSHDEFNLYNLLEIRYFLNALTLKADLPVISDEDWENAKKNLVRQHKNSSKLEICQRLIRDFEETNTKKKYKSDLEIFIRESKMEDFTGNNPEIVLVSTIHKAKGKEFDHVFLLLDNFNSASDDSKRQLYVAITRAKQNLSIHTNNTCFEGIATRNLLIQRINQEYPNPGKLIVQLTHRDVYLSYFESIQYKVSNLKSGDRLMVSVDSCSNEKGEIVVKFSRGFSEFIKAHELLGYKQKEASVNFLVWWKKPEEEKEYIIVLPEVQFEKK